MIHSTTGLVHTIAAMCALLVGAFILARQKATLLHRVLGYAYAASMTLMLVTALLIYNLTGSFNILHIFAVISIIAMAFGLYFAIVRPRGWLPRHYNWICSSYLGLCGGFVAEISTRLLIPFLLRLHLIQSPGSASIWVGVAVFVMVSVGISLMNKNATLVSKFSHDGEK